MIYRYKVKSFVSYQSASRSLVRLICLENRDRISK